jgi:small subunit ribosomal protein S20
MPNTKSARKSAKQAKKNKAKNDAVKRMFKSAVKAAKKAVTAGGADVKEKLRLAQKALDKAAKMNVIKRNTAGRLLSRVMAQARLQRCAPASSV